MPQSANGLDAEPQAIMRPLTPAAIFLVVTINPGDAAVAAVRSLCADFAGIVRTVWFRDPKAGLCCVLGFGAAAWHRLFGAPLPAELHPFREIGAGQRQAPATAGDILFHIRAERMDHCFELATLILEQLGDAVAVADEVHGFQYFDNRDLLGFVDGTENPTGAEAAAAILVGGEDSGFAGGSYVIVQKYLHDMSAWNALPTEAQERIIGRTKVSNADLDPALKPSYAHNALTSIVEDGVEKKIVRDNMPFGSPGQGEFGTYFIGYARSPRTIEQMLENMFVGRPSGNYDRLLDFSRAVTGGLFFAPSTTFLASVTVDAPPEAPDGSLGIGSLKGEPQP